MISPLNKDNNHSHSHCQHYIRVRTHTAQTQAQYLLRLTLEFTSELTSALSANIVAMRPRQHVRHLIDLKVKSIAIFMSQRAGNARIYYRRLTKNLVAQTLR